MTTIVTQRRRLTALRAAWLFDGTSAALTANPVVVLDGTTIVAMEPRGTIPDGAQVVDLAGATLLPGLVDTHVHLAFDASRDAVRNLAARDDGAALAAMADAARTAAGGGVTTVRDLGDRNYLSLSLRDATPPGGPLPTIVAAGPPITTPRGHCHYLGGTASGEDGLRRAVREHAARGVDVIKIMASGGNLTPGTHPELPQFTVAELRAAVEEAHRHSLPITAHAHGTPAIAAAVAAGVDGIEHASFVSAEGVDPAPAGLVQALVDQRVALGATAGFAGGRTDAMRPEMIARVPHMLANFRRLYEAGASIVVGTDAGVGPSKPHDVLRWAVAQLGDIGMGAAEALRTVTSTAAAVCGLGHRKGRLAPGFDADVVAVDGNPLVDPSALHRIRVVYVRGTAVRPAESE
ncbi:MAG TPA: amidohydrolase family protein [Pseudonocardiaceae bacterium]|jgi:imidazolonepropionase-like amidohydrolase